MTEFPINIGTGNKYLQEEDFAVGALKITRRYNSQILRTGAVFSSGWTHTWSRWIARVGQSGALLYRPDGRTETAALVNSAVTNGKQLWTLPAYSSERLMQIFNAAGSFSTGWVIITVDGSEESYDTNGRLTSIQTAQGRTQYLTYSDGTIGPNGGYALTSTGTPTTTPLAAGLLIRVTDDFGRNVTLGYNSNGQIVTATDGLGQVYLYVYDANGNLTSITYPDSKVRQYLNDESAYAAVSFPQAVTGILDENGNRYATYSYDSQGRAISSSHWADAAATILVDQTSVAFSTDVNGNPLSSIATDARGTQRTYGLASVQNLIKGSGVNQPGGAGCGAAASGQAFDANGNLASKVDFDGNQTCFANDLTRNLETARLEGLAPGTSCPANLANYTPAAGTVQRLIQTQWHSAFRIKTADASPLKLSYWIYNGEADPTNGNVPVTCAPSTALLPDGTPIAVLCKRVEQATTDGTGASGFAAAPTGNPRVSTYTYNQYGQVLTSTGPRGNLPTGDPNYAPATTTYVYYAATDTANTPPHYQMGDLAQITDALGHVTQLLQYDGNGRVLQEVDANGTTNTFAYFPRGWLQSRTVVPSGASPGQTTSYAYDGTGQLKTVTLPDGSQISYTYDAAHRLTQLADSAGDSINYTLDAMGNRVTEQVKDPAGNLTRQVSRVYDALNRLQAITGALQ